MAGLLRQLCACALAQLYVLCFFTHLSIELSLRILLANALCKVPLHRAHLLVSLLCEARLHAHHGLETRVEVRDAQLEQLRQLGEQLLVDRLEEETRIFKLLLGAADGGERGETRETQNGRTEAASSDRPTACRPACGAAFGRRRSRAAVR